MKCIDCNSSKTRVISTDEVNRRKTWRYIKCLDCGTKFKTEEVCVERLKSGPRPWKDNWKCKPYNPAVGEKVASSVLTEADVLRLREMAANGCPRQELIKTFGVNPSTIDRIIKRKSWKHI